MAFCNDCKEEKERPKATKLGPPPVEHLWWYVADHIAKIEELQRRFFVVKCYVFFVIVPALSAIGYLIYYLFKK